MVSLTELAAKEIHSIISQQAELAKKDDTESGKIYLRVGVKGGGCSGFSYTLDLTEVKSEEDEEWEHSGVTVICDSKSMLYLDGTVVDFKDSLMGRGFTFSNPNSTSTCGCGSSFSA